MSHGNGEVYFAKIHKSKSHEELSEEQHLMPENLWMSEILNKFETHLSQVAKNDL